MEMAANLEPSFHRSIGYPFLMRITGFLTSNWPIIIIQGLAVSILLYRVLAHFVERNLKWVHFFTVVVLAFSTSMSWYAAQLMPDVFTLILALIFILIVLEKGSRKSLFVVYGVGLFIALTTHLSHIPIVILLLGSFGIAHVLKRFQLALNQWLTLILPLVVVIVFTMSYNAVWGHGFRLSMASNVFITANLGEMGLLKGYLDEQCAEKNYVLCEIKDQLPLETGGYLWAKGNPVDAHPDGWAGMNEDCAPIVHDFLTKPKYLIQFVFAATKSTLEQMFQIELGSGLEYSYVDGSPPSWPMHSHFSLELNEYLTSVQNKESTTLPISFFQWMNYLSLALAFLIIGWAILTNQMTPQLMLVLLVAFAFYFFNAAVTGILANVYERLQCRLLPLIPLVAILVFAQLKKLPGQNTGIAE